MQESPVTQKVFPVLAAFADFILKDHLEEYVREGLRLSYETNLPIMKFFRELSDQQLFELSMQGSGELLKGLAEGRPEQMLTDSIERWKNNQLPWMEKDDVVTEDITLLAHVRKKTLLHFIPRFTSEPAKIIALVRELDEWQLDYSTQTFKTFIGLLQERISRQLGQLKESDERFKQAQAVTHIGNYVWELDTQRLTWSDELYRIYSLDPKTTTVTNEIAARYHHPDDREVVREGIRRSKESLRPFDFHYRIILANGQVKTLHSLGEVEVDEGGQPVKIFGTTQDVTSQKEIERKLEENIREKIKAEEILLRRTMELQQSNANLQEFAFVASHDLKEPLRKISTLGDRLLQTERDNFTAAGKVYLDKIVNAAVRMQQMVDDLLSLSQITEDAHVEKVSLDQLLADVLQTFEPHLESMRGIVHADPLPEAEVVPSQFRQLFQNLIANSLKFAKKDLPPVLTIRWSRIHEKDISDVALRKASSYLKLTFTDNGIGFDNRFADKIFAIFQRLHTRSEYDGTGIGLAICRKIVETHGGTIQATSTLEQGSEFTIIIPDGTQIQRSPETI